MHSLLKNLNKKSSVVLISGYKSRDAMTVKVLNQLKEIDSKIQFSGAGGTLLNSNENFKSFGDNKCFTDKPFIQYKNFELQWQNPLNLNMIKTNYQVYTLYQEMKKNGFFDQFTKEKIKDTKLIVTVGNNNLQYWINNKITKLCTEKDLPRPVTVHIGKTSRLMKANDHEELDYFVQTFPYQVSRVDSLYEFPGQQIGKQVVYDAYQFLYQQEAQYKELLKDNVIYLHKHMNHIVMEQMIFKLRNEFREQMNIPDGNQVIFISPGDQDNEINTNLKLGVEGVQNLIQNYTYKTNLKKKDFTVIVSLPDNYSSSLIQKYENLGLQIIVLNGNQNGQRYKAMCASDFGACQNGDSVLECAAFQLPVVIFDQKDFLDSYKIIDINLVSDGEVYPELMGQMFPEKMAELWSQWLFDQKIKYKLSIETGKRLLSFLPQLKSTRQHSLEYDSNEMIPYKKPDYTLKEFLKQSLDKGNTISQLEQPKDKWGEELRNTILDRGFQFNCINYNNGYFNALKSNKFRLIKLRDQR